MDNVFTTKIEITITTTTSGDRSEAWKIHRASIMDKISNSVDTVPKEIPAEVEAHTRFEEIRRKHRERSVAVDSLTAVKVISETDKTDFIGLDKKLPTIYFEGDTLTFNLITLTPESHLLFKNSKNEVWKMTHPEEIVRATVWLENFGFATNIIEKTRDKWVEVVRR